MGAERTSSATRGSTASLLRALFNSRVNSAGEVSRAKPGSIPISTRKRCYPLDWAGWGGARCGGSPAANGFLHLRSWGSARRAVRPHMGGDTGRRQLLFASTASLQSNGLVFGEAIRKCREAVLKAGNPYGVVDIAFWGVEAVPASYAGPVVSTGVTAVYQHQGGLEARGAAVGCHFGEKGGVIIAQR